jgi:hypothetical protein
METPLARSNPPLRVDVSQDRSSARAGGRSPEPLREREFSRACVGQAVPQHPCMLNPVSIALRVDGLVPGASGEFRACLAQVDEPRERPAARKPRQRATPSSAAQKQPSSSPPFKAAAVPGNQGASTASVRLASDGRPGKGRPPRQAARRPRRRCANLGRERRLEQPRRAPRHADARDVHRGWPGALALGRRSSVQSAGRSDRFPSARHDQHFSTAPHSRRGRRPSPGDEGLGGRPDPLAPDAMCDSRATSATAARRSRRGSRGSKPRVSLDAASCRTA